jgi:hypothetical protein
MDPPVQLEVKHVGDGSVFLQTVAKWYAEDPVQATIVLNVASSLVYEVGKHVTEAVAKMVKSNYDRLFRVQVTSPDQKIDPVFVEVTRPKSRTRKRRLRR